MKRLIFLLSVILISFSLQAQDKVLIPKFVLDSVIDELTIKDGLVIELSRKDSVITILKHKDSINLEKIKEYKLSGIEYEKVIYNLEQLALVAEAEKRDLKKELRKVKIRKTLIIIGEAVIIVLLL